MPGPAPKPPNIRQRRNKEVTAADLIDTSPLADGKAPTLRKRRDKLGHPIPWSREVRRWWRDIWASPMAREWTTADIHDLLELAKMKEEVLLKPSAALRSEIRLWGARFGLDPMSRRRLQWQLKRAADQTPAGQTPATPPASEDPRRKLVAVK
jgi:hypothetical protein